jgi:hypothetical protein
MSKQTWNGWPPNSSKSGYHWLHRKGWLSLSAVLWDHNLTMWIVDSKTSLDPQEACLMFDYVEPISWAIVHEVKINHTVIL